MIVLIGLGNPSTQYSKTRHNIGFIVADAIHAAWGFPPWRKQCQGMISKGTLDSAPVMLFKPQTYMNCSGTAITSLMQFYKCDLSQLIVFHDDLEVTKGTVKIKDGGGHGGHNGLRSLNALVGSGYKRVRLGIGRPDDLHMTVSDFVLGEFLHEDWLWIECLLKVIEKDAPSIAQGTWIPPADLS